MGATVVLTAAAVVALVGVVLVARAVGNVVRTTLQRVMGDYFEYASIFAVITLAVVALIVFMYFVVPLPVWLLLILVVIVSVVSLLEVA